MNANGGIQCADFCGARLEGSVVVARFVFACRVGVGTHVGDGAGAGAGAGTGRGPGAVARVRSVKVGLILQSPRCHRKAMRPEILDVGYDTGAEVLEEAGVEGLQCALIVAARVLPARWW